MFPLSLSGSIRLHDPGMGIAGAVDKLVHVLDEAGADEVRPERDTVSFTSSLFSGGDWSVIGPFDAGVFNVELEDTLLCIHYEFSTVALLKAVSAGVAVFGAAALFLDGWQRALEIAAVGWSWLFGMNYLTALMRIPSRLKRALRETG